MSIASPFARHDVGIGAGGALAFAALAGMALLGGLTAAALGVAPAKPSDALDGSLREAAAIAINNAGPTFVPIALATLTWDQLPGIRLAGDAIIAALLIANGANIGIGFARAGTDLVSYLPHLPAEWAAIACGAGTWIYFRLAPPTDRRGALLRASGFAGVLLVVGALLEAYASPVIL